MGCRLSSNPSSECRATLLSILIIRTTYPFTFDVEAGEDSEPFASPFCGANGILRN